MNWAELLARLLPWGVVGFQGWVIYALFRQHGRVLLSHDRLHDRLERLERSLQALADPHTGHEHAPAASDGLPLGSPAPDFTLPDLDGRERTLQELLGRPLLLVFFDPHCSFCVRMAPRLGQLPADGPRVVVVSNGDPDEHRRLATEHQWHCDVLLQHEWQVSNAYHASGTPTGYLLDAEGRIASDLAVGADALFRLVVVGDNGRVNGLDTMTLREKARVATDRARTAGLAVRESHLRRDGLPIGTPAPDFRLPDLAGVEHSLAEFRGKPVLLVFSDPECGPCQALTPDLVELHRRRGAELAVVMIGRGDPDANRAKARQHGVSFPVLLQKQWEVSKEYAMFATPIGYLIDEHGIIAQDVAVGADALLGLVARHGSQRQARAST